MTTLETAARAAYEALSHSGWRSDMENAPRDRDVLLYAEATGEQFVAFWGTQIETGAGEWVFGKARDPETGDRISFIVRAPTHWRLPPSPPETKESD